MSQSRTHTTKSIPFIHDTPLIGSYPALMKDRLGFLLRLAREGDVCGFHLGPLPIIMLNRPEHVQYILVEHAYDFSKGRLMHKAVGGNGLFISEGDFHRHQRKLMAPHFQPRHIAAYADSIVDYGGRFLQQWQDGEAIDLNKQMIALTMSIIGKILFDADMLSETDELGAAMAVGFEHAVHVMTSLFTPPPSWPTTRNRRVRAANQVIESRLQHMIDERRADPSIHHDVLSALLQARDEDNRPMSDRQLLDECLILFSAGHETTAAALTWTCYLLCQHSDIYQKVRQEVDTVLQGRAPTYDDLPGLSYCLQVFKETLRLYPPAASILRESLHNVEIDGYSISDGTTLFLSPYTLHRRPEYFPEPERFDPDRFTPEREKQLPRYAYIPFGAGPRICIGNHLALMEGQLLIALLVQRATFTLLPDQVIEPDSVYSLALRPAGQVLATVQSRDYEAGSYSD
jgi:cytochrome P450